jgi:hypothetical protein
MSLHCLALGSVRVSEHWFENYCRVFDASPWLAGLETLVVFGPAALLVIIDCRTLRRVEWQWLWHMWANRVLAVLGLGYIALHLVALRAPWFTGQAGGTDRITIWTARLSSTVAGAPALAFALTLGLAALLWSISGACLRAFGALGKLDGSWLGRNRSAIVLSLCTLDFLIALATIAAFTTGG